jgi:hypothetical protein
MEKHLLITKKTSKTMHRAPICPQLNALLKLNSQVTEINASFAKTPYHILTLKPKPVKVVDKMNHTI